MKFNARPDRKFKDRYPNAHLLPGASVREVKVDDIGQAAPVEAPPWSYDYGPWKGKVELWICPDETRCWSCDDPTRFMIWEATGTRQFVCSMECGTRAAKQVWRGPLK